MATQDTAMHQLQSVGDSFSLAGIVAAFSGVLPAFLGTIALLLSIVWYSLQIMEWLDRRRVRRTTITVTHEENINGPPGPA